MTYPKLEYSVVKSVLKTIVFFDSLGLKIPKPTIVQFLSENRSSLESIEISLSVLEDLEIVKRSGDYYALFARSEAELKAVEPLEPLSLFSKLAVQLVDCLPSVNAVYSVKWFDNQRSLILDLTGSNPARISATLCKMLKTLTGIQTCYISRYNNTQRTHIFSDLILSRMTALIRPLELEKFIKRNNSSFKSFPNRSIENNELLQPFLNSQVDKDNKRNISARNTNDFELFTKIERYIEEHKLEEKWAKNDKIYQQWLLPRLSQLNRKYHLV